MADKIGHEVMVCNNGAFWTLRLRRTDTGPIDLPERYFAERTAIQAAHQFVLERSKSHPTDKSHPTEGWFCLAGER